MKYAVLAFLLVLAFLAPASASETSVSATVSQAPGAGGAWTDAISPAWRNPGQGLNISIQGSSFTGAATLQRSFDGSNWMDVARWAGSFEGSLTDSGPGVLYRLGVKEGDFSSGLVSLRLSKGGGRIPERPGFTLFTLFDGQTAVASGASYTSGVVDLSPFEGVFAFQVKIEDAGTAGLDAQLSADGTNFAAPDTNGDGTCDEGNVFDSMTGAGGPAGDGRYYRQMPLDACRKARFVLSVSGGSPVTPTVTLIAR